MAVDSDANLTDLAAEILRDAVRVYGRGDLEERVVGCQLMLAAGAMGVFPGGGGMAGAYPAAASEYRGDPHASLRAVFGLPGRLPAVRLPPDRPLALLARSAPLMARLEALAAWLGRDGRLVGAADELSAADAAQAARRAGIRPEYLPYLWEYALTSGWFELQDERGADRTWAVRGQTARRWADGDDSGALHVWAVLFAAVLACALDVAAAADPGSARRLNLRGQGAVAGLVLFLARRPGVSVAEVSGLIMDGALGGQGSLRARRAWDGWVREHGDPGRLLLGARAGLGAVTVPDSGSGLVGLTPLALWALRGQLRRDGVEVPLLPARTADMSAADLAAFAGGVSEAEFETESAAWVAGRGPERAARELLEFAASADAQARLDAVNLTRGIGMPAHLAWRDAVKLPQLRGYARIALTVLASEAPDSTLPLVLEPSPDDVTWVATDLLALACGDANPDPGQVAAEFAEAVPAGEEEWIFDLMARSTHPDAAGVLAVLGQSHPDRRVRRAAQHAAAAAARVRPVARSEPAPARSGGY